MAKKNPFKKFKQKVSPVLKTTGRAVARFGAQAAPIAGAFVLGPAGAAAGTALGVGLTRVHQKGDTKGKQKARLKRTLITGAASFGASAAVGLLPVASTASKVAPTFLEKLTGGGGTGVFSRVTSLFGGGSGNATPRDRNGVPQFDTNVYGEGKDAAGNEFSMAGEGGAGGGFRPDASNDGGGGSEDPNAPPDTAPKEEGKGRLLLIAAVVAVALYAFAA